MTTLILVFIMASTAAVYVISLRYFRSHPLTPRQTKWFILGAFGAQSVICIWIGISIGRLISR